MSDSPLRVTFVNTGTIRENASTIRCLELGRLLVRDGHEVRLVVTDQAENRDRYGDAHDGIRMTFTAVGSGREQVSKLAHLLRDPADVFHCMSSGSSVHFPAWLASRARRARVIMDFDEWQSLWHEGRARRYQAAWERFACAVSDHVIFASRYLESQLGRHVARHRRSYLPYAVDVEQFARDSAGWEAVRAEYDGRLLAVYMGSLLPQYDAGRVLDAVAPVVAAEPRALFLFIGGGPMREELESRTRAAGLGDAVRFLGYLPSAAMTAHLRAAHALLFPIADTVLNRSRSPNKTFQYLAARRPIVTNRVGNVAEVLGDAAAYFDFDDAGDFARAILRALHGEVPPPSESLVAAHTFRARYAEYLAVLRRTLAA